MTGHTTLILGGARSGKSSWAEQLAGQSEPKVLFVATATAGDDEMAERIASHQARRPALWRTVEEPERMRHVIELHALPGETVVVDCLTMWVSAVMLNAIAPEGDADSVAQATWSAIEASLVDELKSLCTLARERDLSLILVSNEVGMGIVPATPLGRHFRDILGRVNQAVAETADAVILMVAGLPFDLKRAAGDTPTPSPMPAPDRR